MIQDFSERPSYLAKLAGAVTAAQEAVSLFRSYNGHPVNNALAELRPGIASRQSTVDCVKREAWQFQPGDQREGTLRDAAQALTELHDRMRLGLFFHSTFVALQRVDLLVEELAELVDAMTKRDPVALADGLADLLYVLLGTAAAYSIDLGPVFAEVHRSNMTKVPGGHKPLKGEMYSPPRIRECLASQADSKPQ